MIVTSIIISSLAYFYLNLTIIKDFGKFTEFTVFLIFLNILLIIKF